MIDKSKIHLGNFKVKSINFDVVYIFYTFWVTPTEIDSVKETNIVMFNKIVNKAI